MVLIERHGEGAGPVNDIFAAVKQFPLQVKHSPCHEPGLRSQVNEGPNEVRYGQLLPDMAETRAK